MTDYQILFFNPTPLLYISIGVNLILLFLIFYLWRTSKQSKDKKSTDEIISTVFKEAELKASFIIHDASEKAKTIITEATQTRQQMEESMRGTFQEIFTSMRDQIKQENQLFSTHMQQIINDISGLLKQESVKMIGELKNEAKTQVQLFAKTMHEENKGIHNELLDQIKLEIDVIKNELQAYRDEEYKKIDQHLTIVLQTLLKEYLKDTLSYEINEEIIFKALEKYKDNIQTEENTTSSPPNNGQQPTQNNQGN